MSAPCDVIVLAAFEPELAPLRGVFRDDMGGEVGGNVVEARAIGVGLPAAAVGAAIQLIGRKPRAAVAIGTCGAYPSSRLAIGNVVVARRIRLVSPSALRGLAEFPQPMLRCVDAHGGLADSIARTTGVGTADVATTLAITTDDATAARIAQSTGADVEHLELYGVATACAAMGIPFGALLAVANLVGASAREQWRMHHQAASRAAADAAVRWLQRGRVGELSLAVDVG